MTVGKWSIVGALGTVLAFAGLMAFRPELADNPNIWLVLATALPGIVASAKAEKSANEVTKVREELKNGVITQVVKDAMVSHEEDKEEVRKNESG